MRKRFSGFEAILTIEQDYTRCDVRPYGTDVNGNIEECDAYGGFEDHNGEWHEIDSKEIDKALDWAYGNGY